MKALRIFGLVVVLFTFASAMQAQITSLALNSAPGDWVGQGQPLSISTANAAFGAQGSLGSSTVSIWINGPDQWWYLKFGVPNGQSLNPGIYTGAASYPNSDQPSLSISGNARSCDSTGSFTVLELGYDIGGQITDFDATFEQYCDGSTAALRGEIRYNAHSGVLVMAPTHVAFVENQSGRFDVSAIDASSGHVALSATGVPAGASFVDHGDNTGTFSWTPVTGQAGTYSVAIQGDNLTGDSWSAIIRVVVTLPPPSNDDFDHATVIPQIPFTIRQDASTATAADDPYYCLTRNQTVWFSFTPTQNIRLEANTFGSNYDTALSVYTGVRGALNQIGCNNDSNGTSQSRVRFDAIAGTTYYFMVSSLYPVSSANLVFNLVEAPPLLSISVTVNQFGTVDPTTGTATVSGLIACTQPVYVVLEGALQQMFGDAQLNGDFGAWLPCSDRKPWSVTVQSWPELWHGRADALFTGGKADVYAYVFSWDPDTGQSIERNLVVTVILRGKE